MIRSTTSKWVTGAVTLVVMLAGGGLAQAQTAPTVTFEQMVADLASADSGVRLRAARALKQSAYPEASLPLVRAILDAEDAIQLEAIAAELNILLTDKVVPRKRVGLVVEVRNQISASSVFQSGAGAIDPEPVPLEILTALRTASHDENPRVSVEALYAFGVLSDNVYGRDRQALRAASAPELIAALGVPQAEVRACAVRVIARLYGWRAGDGAVDQRVGDAVVGALNDREAAIRLSAIDAIGALRYERGVQAVADVLNHYQRGTVAVAALSALARIAHQSSVPLFASALTGRDASLRLAAIEGLARRGDETQEPLIAAALAAERNQEVLLAGQFASAMLSDGPIDSLVDGLTRSRSRERSLGYLIDVAPGRSAIFSPHVQDPDPAVRIDLLDVLGLSGDPQALSIAARFQQDAEPAVARAAARAVSRLQSAESRLP